MASIISAGTTSGTSLNLSGDTSGVLQLASNGSTTAVTIDTSQNVGIGTTTPGTKLNVFTGSTIEGLRIQRFAGAYYSELRQTDGPESLAFLVGDGATVAERMRISGTGAVVLQGGTTTANGIGITFPASQSASSDANTLDDYEEGTWTATLLCTSGTITLKAGNQTGVYTKIGRVVNVSGYFEVNSIGSPSGRLRVAGLPFVQTNSDCVAVGICYLVTTNAYTGVPWCSGEGGNSHVYIDRNAGTGADPAIDLASAIKANTEFYVNFTYTTS